MGEVILGMPGPWADDFCEASDHYTTKFGGLPDWPIPNMVIPHNLRVCRSCGNSLLLVAQVYSPVSTKTLTIEERQIFVFGCISASCEGNPESWIAIRVQRCSSSKISESGVEENVLLPDLSYKASNTDWRDDFWSFDEGNDDDEDLEELGRAMSEAASLASHSKRKSIPHQYETAIDSSSTSQKIKVIFSDTTGDRSDRVNANPVELKNATVINPELQVMEGIEGGNTAADENNGDAMVQVLPCFYVYNLKEAIQKDVASICLSYTSLSIKENQDYLDDSAPQEAWDEEGYEYDRALSASRTYLKFKKRMDAYPEQCFRYSYGGKPLLAAEEVGDPGRCELCGGSRHYEMQLMPPLLYFLQQAASKHNYTLENWNWMTLLIYTCSGVSFDYHYSLISQAYSEHCTCYFLVHTFIYDPEFIHILRVVHIPGKTLLETVNGL